MDSKTLSGPRLFVLSREEAEVLKTRMSPVCGAPGLPLLSFQLPAKSQNWSNVPIHVRVVAGARRDSNSCSRRVGRRRLAESDEELRARRERNEGHMASLFLCVRAACGTIADLVLARRPSAGAWSGR